MSNLLASFNAGVSGLRSAQASLNATSHNLANAQTKGYTRQQVLITDSFYQSTLGSHDNYIQVGTGTTIVKTRQIRNEFLDGQYRLQVGRQKFYEINRDTAMEIEDMLGELNGTQFQTSITDLIEAMSEMAKYPDDVVTKEELVSIAGQFLERAQVLQTELNTYQSSLNLAVQQKVDSINSLVTKVHELNKLIQKYEATGEDANDYRDKRNLYLDELGEIINIKTSEERDGTIMIYSEGAYLLDATNQYFLTVEYESETTQLLKPVWETGGNFFLHDSLAYSSENNTDVGSLRGLMVARGNYPAKYTDVPVKPKAEDYKDANGIMDSIAYNSAMIQYNNDVDVYNESVGASIIMTVQTQLDMLFHGIVTSINDALCPNKELTLSDGTKITVLDEDKALIGDDELSSVGTEIFSRRNYDRYTKVNVEILQEDGTTKRIDVYEYKEEDPTDSYSLYTINQIIINPTVLRDSSTLPCKYTEENGGGYATPELLGIVQSFDNKIGTLNPNSMTEYNVLNYYEAMVNDLGVTGGIWNGIVSNQEITVIAAEEERQKVMGVSGDEELSDLIKFQRCYDASSRYITTVSEMLEYLIERLGG